MEAFYSNHHGQRNFFQNFFVRPEILMHNISSDPCLCYRENQELTVDSHPANPASMMCIFCYLYPSLSTQPRPCGVPKATDIVNEIMVIEFCCSDLGILPTLSPS